jgi:hypothetical protein
MRLVGLVSPRRLKSPPYRGKKNARDLKAAGENPGFRRKLEETV